MRAKMDISHNAIQDLPFIDMVCIQACMLDPRFGLSWADHDVMAGKSTCLINKSTDLINIDL